MDEVKELVRALQEWCEEQTCNVEDVKGSPKQESARL